MGFGNGVSGMGCWEWGVRALSPPLVFPQLDIGTIYSAPGNERVEVTLGDTFWDDTFWDDTFWGLFQAGIAQG